MNYKVDVLYAVTLSLLVCASLFVFSISQAPNQAFSTIMPKYLMTKQSCPLIADAESPLASPLNQQNALDTLDTMAGILDADMAKLHALNEQFKSVNEKWNVIFSKSNAAHESKKLGTQINVTYHDPPQMSALTPFLSVSAISSEPPTVIPIGFEKSIIPHFSKIPVDPPLTASPSDPLTSFSGTSPVGPLTASPSDPLTTASTLKPITSLNPSCFGRTSYDLLNNLPQDESHILLRNVTDRIPVSSFDNETGNILEKLSSDARAELMKIAIYTDADSNLTRSIIENQSRVASDNQGEPISPTVATGNGYAIRFVSAASPECQLPPSLSSKQLSVNTVKELCSKLGPDERENILNKVINQFQAGPVALAATTYFASMAEIINYVYNNITFMESLDDLEIKAFGSVKDKPTPQNMVSFLIKIQPATSINFIKMFYPPEDRLQLVFRGIVKGEGDEIIKHINQDEQLSSAIKKIYINT